MTREEHIIYAKNLRIGLALTKCFSEEGMESLSASIQALEQEPETDALDKIREEIIQMPTISLNANDIYKSDVLAIIDKYRWER